MKNFDFSSFREKGIHRVGELNPYINLACDLRCDYCYMYDFLAKARDKKELMHPSFLLGMVDFFCEYSDGLDRMTLLGGEPTLHPDITEICNEAAERPIRELRMTTNGISLHELKLERLKPHAFDHVSVSIDGITASINDATRGKGTYKRIIETIGLYREANVRLSINYTVTTNNIDHLNETIAFFKEQGVSIINFHRASLDGYAYKHQDILVGGDAWVSARDRLFAFIQKNASAYPDLIIRIPYTFLTQEQIQHLGYVPIQEQNYHSPQGGHRLIVFPTTPKGRGLCYMSSDVIGHPNAELGTVSSDGIFKWNEHSLNEMGAYKRLLSPNVSTQIKGQTEGLASSSKLMRVSHSYKATIHTNEFDPISSIHPVFLENNLMKETCNT